MRPCHTRLLAGWLVVVIVQVTSAASEVKVYGRLRGEVDLEQDVLPANAIIPNILWKEDQNLAMNWDGEQLRAYRQFKERGHLNTSTGVMTITGLIREDSKVYTPEINNKKGTPIRLEVITDVPAPTLKSCDNTASTCTLVCEGDITEAGQVIYTWKADNNVVPDVSGNYYTIKENSSNIKEIKEFSCELNNEFSREGSNPVPNPFTTAAFPEPVTKPNISTGVTVFICLLLPVLLLALFHKWKTGVFFFEKTSMPWEADFWKRNERPQREAESNGTAPSQPRDQIDEETPMK